MPQSIQDHLGTAVEGKFQILRFEQLFKVIDVLGPNLFGPDTAAVVIIFADVTNDVILLQLETH
jgi:hypothetical protein